MFAHALPVQRAIVANKFPTERTRNGRHGATTGRRACPRNGVGIDDRCTSVTQHRRHCALAAAHTPREAHSQNPLARSRCHRPTVRKMA
jgi:hypothetical protein